MKKISLVLLCAGSSTRFNDSTNKVLYKIDNKEVFRYSLEKFEGLVDEIVIVINHDDLSYFTSLNLPVTLVLGGEKRNESVRNGLLKVTGDYVLIHDAARPLVDKDDIASVIKALDKYKVATLYKPCIDTIRYGNFTIDRNNVKLVSTPQGFRKELIDEIITNRKPVTDEASIFNDEYEIGFVKETSSNLKLTTKDDLDFISYKLSHTFNRVGHSLDYHPFSNKSPLYLGGYTFKGFHTLEGHSDGDVIYHVVAESIMGACGMGDLGTLFPDNDPSTLGIRSSEIVKEVVKRVNGRIINIDIMVYLIKPNLVRYKLPIEENIKALTHCNNVNVKAATLNKRGLISLEEGIGAEAICLVELNK